MALPALGDGRKIEDKESIEDVGQITLGEFQALANWGQAYIYAELDVKLDDKNDGASELIKEAQEKIEKLKELHAEVIYPEIYPDCEGWILYKLGGTNYINAIDCLKKALSKAFDAEIYFHLALAHFQMMEKTKDPSLIEQIQIHCQHALELGIAMEYKSQIDDLLKKAREKAALHSK